MRKIITLVVAVLVLTGCGGGGGNTRPDPAPIFTTTDAQRSVGMDGQSSVRTAARATPRFGSVTQSMNQDASGVSTDRARATLSAGPRLTLTVTRQNGDPLTLDTALDAIESSDGSSEVTGRSAAQALLLKYDDTSAIVARVGAEWHTEYGDWLAGGYWLHVMGDINEGVITSVEVGAFMDGPEIRGTPEIPLSGTATYDGIAAGVYASTYGTDISGVPEGTWELGEFNGDLSLTADFATASISGMVDNIHLDSVGETPTGATYDAVVDSDYQLVLGAASFGNDGGFTGRDVTLTHPSLSIRSEGSWGGRFSTVDDSAGNPRLVAGTLGGTGTTAGGSSASFVGGFYGVTPQFE